MELRFGILSYYYIREREGRASIDVFFFRFCLKEKNKKTSEKFGG